MRVIFIYLVTFLLCTSVKAQKQLQQPRLVVGIVVDQMRWDYLYKYYDEYSEDGFKKLMREGYNCQNTMINYLPSFTGPGHASIYTGTVPALHGIAANDWILPNGKGMYCVEDGSVQSIGGSNRAGAMSPANMIATTITDELEIVTQQKAKVFGVGIKDRGSILPAGHAADGAFWFDDSTGNFISSSFYIQELPKWVNAFNDQRLADKYMDYIWNLSKPLNEYNHSTTDNIAWEGKFPGERTPVFPHRTPKKEGRGYNGIRYMPVGNTLTLDFAKECVRAEGMGKDDITDFLAITLSTTDYAGHTFGPDALEMEDMYLRLDKEIAGLLKYLNEQVGKGQYTIFLTADHGATHNAGYMNSLRIPAGSETQVEATDRLNAHLESRFGNKEIINGLYNYQVYLNEEVIAKSKIDREGLKIVIEKWLYEQDEVAYVIDMENMDKAVVPAQLKEMVINGYYRGRSGVMQVIMQPGWYSGYGKTGTTHGSWNPYDTHIPLLWYGHGIKAGETYRTISITDIAPTLAALLHIQMPSASTGHVITELFE